MQESGKPVQETLYINPKRNTLEGKPN